MVQNSKKCGDWSDLIFCWSFQEPAQSSCDTNKYFIKCWLDLLPSALSFFKTAIRIIFAISNVLLIILNVRMKTKQVYKDPLLCKVHKYLLVSIRRLTCPVFILCWSFQTKQHLTTSRILTDHSRVLAFISIHTRVKPNRIIHNGNKPYIIIYSTDKSFSIS